MSRYSYVEFQERERSDLARKVEWLDTSLENADHTLSELRAVDTICRTRAARALPT